jgi:putative FmdB family regulatory protein
MPLYDVRCTSGCGKNEVYVPLRDADNIVCPDCSGPAVRLVSPVLAIGALFSKPIEFGQIGKKFETNEQLRNYKKENPDAKFVQKDSKEWRSHYDSVRNHCDKKAKKQGFSDHEARGKFLKKRQQARND